MTAAGGGSVNQFQERNWMQQIQMEFGQSATGDKAVRWTDLAACQILFGHSNPHQRLPPASLQPVARALMETL